MQKKRIRKKASQNVNKKQDTKKTDKKFVIF